jgi:four helix bundle protein
MAVSRNYRDLDAWSAAMRVAIDVYTISSTFPSGERFGLVAQIRRAAVSIPSNIAEGEARKSPKAFVHFLGISLGSLAEVDTGLEIAVRRGYLSPPRSAELQEILRNARRLIFGLRRSQMRRLTTSVALPTLVLASMIVLTLWK